MENFKIKDQDYYRTEDIEIEVTKVIAPAIEEVTKTETLTVGQIKEKIQKITNEKILVIGRYDEEINSLQAILDTLKVEDVELKKFVSTTEQKVEEEAHAAE